MKLIETRLPGCVVVEPTVLSDDRGFFYESFNFDRAALPGMSGCFRQGNISSSRRGVLRGLHYQWPNPQGKYVTVLQGEAWDVAVDIRRGSPTFGEWTAVLLSGENKRHMWIPEGFAHGFVVTGETALFSYLCTATYDPTADASIRWDDPKLAIDWPVSAPSLSPKDANASLLANIPADRLPAFDA
ncbi:dTDP-4-dehydrorhamnose 3,5-epimerase [Lysobacter sp. HA18]